MNLKAIVFSFAIIGILIASLISYIIFRFFKSSSAGKYIDSLSIKMNRFMYVQEKRPEGYLFEIFLIFLASVFVFLYLYILISGFYAGPPGYGLLIAILWEFFVFTGLIYAYTTGSITTNIASSFILITNKFISGLYSRRPDEKK